MMTKRAAILLAFGLLVLGCDQSQTAPAGDDPQAAAPAQPAGEPTASNPPRPPGPRGELLIEDLVLGDGPEVKYGSWMGANYRALLADGTEFDSSDRPNRGVFYFCVPGTVIDGWGLGVLGMREGGTRRLTIPPHLAFGPEGRGDLVPPYATVTYEIEAVNVHNGSDFTLGNGLEMKTEKAGDGSPAVFGSFVKFDVIVYGATDERILFDTHQPGGKPLEMALPGPPGLLVQGAPLPVLPNVNTAVIGIRQGEFRRVRIPAAMAFRERGDLLLGVYQNEDLIYEIDCVEVHTDPNWAFSTGASVEQISPGDGRFIAFGQHIKYHYRVLREDGTELVSTFGGEPIITLMPTRRPPFVEGMVYGLQGMRIGETRRITIQPNLIYGGNPAPEVGLPAGETLTYEVRLLEVSTLPILEPVG